VNARPDDDRIRADFIARTNAGLDGAYRAYGRALYSAALDVLRDDAAAQDCVHDTLLRVWQRSGAYRPERGSLRTFLLTCVRNDAIGRTRDAARRARIEERLVHANRGAYEFDAGDAIERSRLRAAIGRLPAEQRTVLALAFVSHLTHAEIAARLAEPLGTIKSRLRLALRKLERSLRAGQGDA
jgi:RNA polymerase sigma-70 factor (ECF subfamily)